MLSCAAPCANVRGVSGAPEGLRSSAFAYSSASWAKYCAIKSSALGSILRCVPKSKL